MIECYRFCCLALPCALNDIMVCPQANHGLSCMCLSLQSYIDFEIQEGSRERTRQLYERLLQRTQHVKVWLSYAQFEAMPLPQLQEAQASGKADGAADQPAAAANGTAEDSNELLEEARRWDICSTLDAVRNVNLAAADCREMVELVVMWNIMQKC